MLCLSVNLFFQGMGFFLDFPYLFSVTSLYMSNPKDDTIFDELTDKHAVAPFGYNAQGKPRKKPWRNSSNNLAKYHKQRKNKEVPEKTNIPDPEDKGDKDKRLKSAEKELFGLFRESVRTLRAALRDTDPRVRIQAATAATRTSLTGLAKDTLLGDGTSEISIHYHTDAAPDPGTSSPDAVADLESQDQDQAHPRTGRPVTIVR